MARQARRFLGRLTPRLHSKLTVTLMEPTSYGLEASTLSEDHNQVRAFHGGNAILRILISDEGRPTQPSMRWCPT
jgi:hypothetical protein